MLYPKNMEPSLSDQLFKEPTSEYRGTPFWAWNCKVDEQEAMRQIECFKEMGLGGFHVHSRTGLDIPYMGDGFLDTVKKCCDKAEQEQMLCWLYDEDRWPSGAAGGYVTKDPRFRARKLLFTPNKEELSVEEQGGPVKLLGRYAVTLDNGYLASYRRINETDALADGEQEWFAYLEVNATHDPWYNDLAYADTLSKAAIDEFIRQTHDKYYELLGDRFSKSVPAIFTDEPQFNPKETLRHPTDRHQVRIPYTDDLEETYTAAYGESLLDHLPEIFWEKADGTPSLTRYHYHDHTAERFASAFADNIGDWCEKHGLMLTGHMMEEPRLQSQTAVLGDTMRSYRGFQLPGIDMLCDWREYTTAKQAQSASRQYGREGVLSELYGVTNWSFDFRGYKMQGDWQAALGVTVRVPHLSWMSMAGEAKRDYPASISFQSPWYKDYRYIEDHFARVNTAMTRGKAVSRIGVIHPVESFWLHYGNNEQTAQVRSEMERHFGDLTEWLLFGLTDFDFICESLLPQQAPSLPDSDKFRVGAMEYEAIIVPDCETIRRTTFDRLTAFVNNGGRVIFAGQIPRYIDAVETDEVKKFSEKCECVQFSQTGILNAVENLRTIDIIDKNGNRPSKFISQLRQDGDDRWLFIANGRRPDNLDVYKAEDVYLHIDGQYTVTLYDSLTGEIKPMKYGIKNGQTVVPYVFYPQDSLLIRLTPTVNSYCPVADEDDPAPKTTVRALGPVPVTLDEPNVLLLDQAEYCLDNGKWNAREEILRLDNIVRDRLGYPNRRSAIVQPWTVTEQKVNDHILKLRFRIDSEIKVKAPMLALENAENTAISVNGKKIEKIYCGWYVDPCIKKVQLPNLKAGKTVIELTVNYGRKTDVEWCYLLGDFGVRAIGDSAVITEPVTELCFGDWTDQGLPFYGGNLTYHLDTELPGGKTVLSTTRYRGTALKVSVDGTGEKVFAYAPYEAELGDLSAGKHRIDVTVLGSRINSFGQVHNCDETYEWFGPDSWRTEGPQWSYEYKLWQMGLLKAPEFFIY